MKKRNQITVAESESDYREKILMTTGMNEIQFAFAAYVIKRLNDDYRSYFAPDWLSKPFNDKNTEKISAKDVSFVIEKLHNDYYFIESDFDGITYKLSMLGKETIQIHGNFEEYIDFEIERIKSNVEENEKRKVIEELNLRQLKGLAFQAKWWLPIMLLNMILSVIGAYLIFRLGVH